MKTLASDLSQPASEVLFFKHTHLRFILLQYCDALRSRLHDNILYEPSGKQFEWVIDIAKVAIVGQYLETNQRNFTHVLFNLHASLCIQKVHYELKRCLIFAYICPER